MTSTSTYEYSSGCESGWTMYLDQNSISTDHYTRRRDEIGGSEDDDEDLSMVSDASSGPPHYQNNSSHYYAYQPPSLPQDKTKTKIKTKTKTKTRKDLCLDDTASSSIFHFSQDNVPHSDDHNSAGHVYFKDESRTKKGLSFFKSSTKGKSSGSLLGRKRQ